MMNFLFDPWLDDLTSLIFHCIDDGTIGMDRVISVDMIDDVGNWDWRKFQDVLSTNVLLKIAAKKGPMAGVGCNVVGWNGRVNLRFSVKSAYTMCTWTNRPSSWLPPPLLWFKLNSDGARHKVSGFASCGGLIRDNMGQCIHGFVKFIRICSVVEAELWGLFVDLTCAKNMSLNQVTVECDNMKDLRLVQQQSTSHGRMLILTHIKELFSAKLGYGISLYP
ncbi:hypothetical protein V6N13_127134 [Hibiscus sabdariffa]